MKSILPISIILSSLCLVACGDESVNTIQTERSGFAELSQGEKLPQCTSKNEGELLFVADSNALFCCAKNEWNKMNQERRITDTIRVADTVRSSVTLTDTAYLGAVDTLDVGCTTELDSTDYHFLIVTCGSATFKVKDEFPSRRLAQWGEPLVDSRDGNSYKTVVIGTQTWMAEDLLYGADSIRKGGYNWMTALGFSKDCDGLTYCELGEHPQGICPDGWHIPDAEEWLTLSNYVNERNGDEFVALDLGAVGFNSNYPGYDLFGLGLTGSTMTSSQEGDTLYYTISLDIIFNSSRDTLALLQSRNKSDTRNFYYGVRCVKND